MGILFKDLTRFYPYTLEQPSLFWVDNALLLYLGLVASESFVQ
jgi:hypothetical protein